MARHFILTSLPPKKERNVRNKVRHTLPTDDAYCKGGVSEGFTEEFFFFSEEKKIVKCKSIVTVCLGTLPCAKIESDFRI